MRILQFNDSYYVGGAEVMIADLIENLRTEYEFHACSFEGGGALETRLRHLGVQVWSLNKKQGFDPAVVWRLIRGIRKSRIDLLHTHNFYTWLYGAIARLFVPRCRHLHTQHSYVVRQGGMGWPLRYLLGRTDIIVSVSNEVRARLQHLGIPDRSPDGHVVHNGIDTHVFTPSSRQRRLSGKHGAKLVRLICVGRLVPIKNHELLLRGIQKINRSLPYELVIVGDGPLRSRLESLARDLGLGGKVHFFGERKGVGGLLQESDIFVLSSKSEGLSIAILEAMATGLPVVATDVGGNPSLVREAETGFLVQGKPEELAQALQRLISDPLLRRKYGMAGRRRVEEMFSVKRMAEKYRALYTSLLSSKAVSLR